MSEWSWAPDDFAALWFNEARDRFPRPLHFTSRFRYREEFEAHRAAICSRYASEETRAIELALGTLEKSEIRIEVSAETGLLDPSDRVLHKIVGVRDIEHAVIAAQSISNEIAGPVWVRQGRPDYLGNGITSRIPECAPGTLRGEEFYQRDTKLERDSYFSDVAYNSPRERYARLVNRPLVGMGSAVIRIGGLHSRSEPVRIMEWLDFADDGRYDRRIVGDVVRIFPVRRAGIAAELTQWLVKELHNTYRSQSR
ncbi:ESX secretion-associated protein EspG [Nocardia lasii]|uniref:ESX secretion-associated protein EspG n=1 Tax=Nocardia lasii TaxID=1616107 RepID=A0ABW1JVG0_9NOCA